MVSALTHQEIFLLLGMKIDVLMMYGTVVAMVVIVMDIVEEIVGIVIARIKVEIDADIIKMD